MGQPGGREPPTGGDRRKRVQECVRGLARGPRRGERRDPERRAQRRTELEGPLCPCGEGRHHQGGSLGRGATHPPIMASGRPTLNASAAPRTALTRPPCGGHGGSVSRVLSRDVIPLGWMSPPTSSDLPAGSVGSTLAACAVRRPIWSCSLGGLPCPPCYQAGGGLLPHRFTLT